MSCYADYSQLWSHYDGIREAVCPELYLDALKRQVTPLASQRVLDAGCGTGNYSRMMLDAGVGHVTLLDATEGMLLKAEEKCAEYIKSGKAEVRQHQLPLIPYPDGTFDCVVINFVLHHIDRQPHIPNNYLCTKEVFRVLKPGGVFIMAHPFQNQLDKGVWFLHLVPHVLEIIGNIASTQEVRIKMLADAGFKDVRILVPTLASVWPIEIFLNGECPLNPKFRKSTGFLDAFSTEEERAELDARVRQMLKEGTMEAFVKEHDKHRHEVGQFSIIYAYKP